MKLLQAFKFELMPTGIQRRNMHRFAGACRFVFNKALALQQSNHAQGISYMSYVKMAALLPVWKREAGFEWLSQVPSQSLQHALKDLDRAYQGFLPNAVVSLNLKRSTAMIVFVTQQPINLP